MESIFIRQTHDGWIMSLDFDFSEEVKVKTLKEAEEVAEMFRHWVHEFGREFAQYAVEKREEKKE
jgi:hypothetical protein